MPTAASALTTCPDALGVVETELLAELDPHAADREEPRRRVVAPGAIGEPCRRCDDPLRVVDRLLRVVARDRRVDGRVAHGDDRGRGDHAVGRHPPDAPPRTRAPHRASVVRCADESRRSRTLAPAAGRAPVRPAEERERRAEEDLQVDARRAVLDVPDVELDPVVPRERRAAVDLRPAGEPGPDVEPPPLALACTARPGSGASAAGRSRTCRRGRRSRAAAARRSTCAGAKRPDAGDARVAAVDGVAGALLLGVDDHRAELQQLEVDAVLADARLPKEHRPAVLELDRERGGGEERARDDEPEPRERDVRRGGSPRRRRIPGGGDAAAQVVPERLHGRPRHVRRSSARSGRRAANAASSASWPRRASA